MNLVVCWSSDRRPPGNYPLSLRLPTVHADSESEAGAAQCLQVAGSRLGVTDSRRPAGQPPSLGLSGAGACSICCPWGCTQTAGGGRPPRTRAKKKRGPGTRPRGWNGTVDAGTGPLAQTATGPRRRRNARRAPPAHAGAHISTSLGAGPAPFGSNHARPRDESDWMTLECTS
jgi:hypothetical protein